MAQSVAAYCYREESLLIYAGRVDADASNLCHQTDPYEMLKKGYATVARQLMSQFI